MGKSFSIRKKVSISTPDKSQNSKFQTGCGENVRQYLVNTSLHGLKYVGSIYITYFERIFFLLSVVSVLLLSVYFISNVYDKWSATPVIVTFDARSTSIDNFPFPAVTVCNMNKARRSVVQQLRNDSIEECWLQNICYSDYANVSSSRANKWNLSTDWDVFKHFLLNISQPCSQMLLNCRYGLETFDCMKMFTPVLSDEGLCCIFNSLHPNYLYKNPSNASINFSKNYGFDDAVPVDWSPETGYVDQKMKAKATPRPAVGPGSHMGLQLMLNADVADYYCSSTHSAGFKILLHSPNETPRISEFGMFVAPGRENRILVSPRINSASRLIRNINIEQRQCVFANEANLTYFRTYTRRNCEMECFSRMIEEQCGCLLYFLPIINKRTRICSQDDSSCYNTLRVKLERTEGSALCRCKAGCDELAFIGEISDTAIMSEMFHKKGNKYNFTISDEKLRNDIAIVQIYYSDSFYRSFLKEELIGFTEFLSNTGGLLGLFMGFSVLSLVEIFYFLTLRPCCRRMKRNSVHTNANKKVDQPNLISGNYPNFNTSKHNANDRMQPNNLFHHSINADPYLSILKKHNQMKTNWMRPYLD